MLEKIFHLTITPSPKEPSYILCYSPGATCSVDCDLDRSGKEKKKPILKENK